MRDTSSTVFDLQLQVKRLAEENTKLRDQLRTNEEISSNFVQELDELRDTVKKFVPFRTLVTGDRCTFCAGTVEDVCSLFQLVCFLLLWQKTISTLCVCVCVCVCLCVCKQTLASADETLANSEAVNLTSDSCKKESSPELLF